MSWLGRKEGERGDYIEELKVGGYVVFGLSLSQEIHSSLVYKTTGWSLA